MNAMEMLALLDEKKAELLAALARTEMLRSEILSGIKNEELLTKPLIPKS